MSSQSHYIRGNHARVFVDTRDHRWRWRPYGHGLALPAA